MKKIPYILMITLSFYSSYTLAFSELRGLAQKDPAATRMATL